MSNIKKFFSKVKSEVKFSRAGEGHRLNEPIPSAAARNVPAQARPQSSSQQNTDRGPAARAAAEAAQQRFQHQTSLQQTTTSRTADSIRRQAQRELEQEKALEGEFQRALDLKEHYFGNRQVSVESSPMVDHSSFLFKCPDVFGEDVSLPYDELQQQIEETLRLQNKVYVEKVASLKYALELLQASGFVLSDDKESLVYQERSIEPLQLAQDTLMNGEPIQVQLDRNLKLFQPTKDRPSIPPVQIFPQDPLFYQSTVGDVLREKQRQKDLVEKEEMLRTKAMRDRDGKSELNIQYKYTIIRIRMPNEMIIQVIFQANDFLSSLFDYLRSHCLVHNWLPFALVSNADRRVYTSQDENSITFNQCSLVPAALLAFRWDEQALRDVQKQTPNFPADVFIKPEVLANASRL